MTVRNPYILEGDFIETHDGLIFDAKGIRHPDEELWKIAYLRYIPIKFFSPKYEFIGKSEKNWVKSQIEKDYNIAIDDIRFGSSIYVKVYDLISRFTLLKHFKPSYIFHSKMFDFPLQAVPTKDIKTVHRPDQFLKKILTSHDPDPTLMALIQFIITGAEISDSYIGLSGSKMVGLEEKNADYDLIIYGENQSRRVHKFLEDFFHHPLKSHIYLKKLVNISPYTEKNLQRHYQFRGRGFNLSYEQFKKIESKKTHQFLINERDVFIRYIKNDRYAIKLPNFPIVSYKTLGRVSLVGRIVNDTESFFTPGKYNLYILDFQSGKEMIDQRNIEIFTMRGRFLENAHQDDIVLVRGKLEKVIRKGKFTLQVVLGTDPDDLLIQMKKSKEKLS